MLGHTLFKKLITSTMYEVYGTARSVKVLDRFFSEDEHRRIRPFVDADNFDTVIRALGSVQPDIVINCIGLIKQLPIGHDPLTAITINAQLPHRISLICRAANARLIHISTDCVFDGLEGMYTESDSPSPADLYGRTKLLGETTYQHCITLRTSIIGHELKDKLGLVEWFLAQKYSVRGYTRAIYSGFSTLELAKIIERYVLPNNDLSGLYHVSSEPISKYDLLCLVRERYCKEIEIEPYADFVCDRSLDSSRFRAATGYMPPTWEEMVTRMYEGSMSKG
ncbi:MAG: NAD(P)-dependent oxidoreductase [Geobacteraceae bacterium GWC2_53_11]|nr:MAG: NAD(P)-dependent oxidoreductase [Geobacteraceae bacterium GWC2_53_11]